MARNKEIKKRLVFIVDDDPLYSEIVAGDLVSQGIVAQHFLTGEECLDKLHREPDAVLLDFELDTTGVKLDGVATLIQIKKELPDVPIIMLSSHEDLEIVTKTMKIGAYDYIVKNETALLNVNNKLKNIFYRKTIVEELNSVKRVKKIIFATFTLALIFSYFADSIFA